MFVIENKILLSYRGVKSMHYPESPKVKLRDSNRQIVSTSTTT